MSAPSRLTHAAAAWALVVAGARAETLEVEPRALAWERLSPDVFDLAYRLPDTGRRGDDLVPRLRALATATLDVAGEARTLGDLVVASRPLDGDARHAWFRDLFERSPGLDPSTAHDLRDLLLDDWLASSEWDPGREHPRDGILVGSGWELAELGAPWSASRVEPVFEQGAALLVADLATIKEVENDYRAYPDRPGSTIERITPVEGRHLGGTDARGRPFRAVTVVSRSDLPFPFSGYTCDLRILNRIDDDGHLRTDIWSPSDDFHYLAGQDVYLPVATSAGETAAYLVVRSFGFDLAGVPDRREHRREALRGTLGNLKRDAEARFGGGAFPSPATALERMRVLGER